jgi:hypothetical protein
MRAVLSADLPAFRRPRYFDGRLLSVADLQLEQEYHREHARLHNRLLHGWGVVSGLEVRSSGGTIIVEPGVALDSAGDVIVLREVLVLTVAPPSPAPAAMFVTVRYHEAAIHPVVIDDRTEFLDVEEGATCAVLATAPRAPDPGIAIARIIWRTKQWRVDARYRRRRVRS